MKRAQKERERYNKLDVIKKLFGEPEKASVPENKDTAIGPEKTLTQSKSEDYLPRHKLTRMHMEQEMQLQNKIQSKKKDRIEE